MNDPPDPGGGSFEVACNVEVESGMDTDGSFREHRGIKRLFLHVSVNNAIKRGGKTPMDVIVVTLIQHFPHLM